MIIRPLTILSGLAFVLSGGLMFVVKHQSQALDSQISDVNEATARDEQSIRVLQAQWALEADPSRLASLAAQFTGLQPMKPGQLVTMAALGSSLPAAGAKPPGSNPEDPVPALPQLAAAAPAATPATTPATPPAAATAVAAATPAPAAPATVQAAKVETAANVPPAAPVAAPAAAPVAAPVHLAAAAPAPAVPHHHTITPARVAASVPVHHVNPPRPEQGSSVYMASARSAVAPAHAMPMGAQLVPVRAVATPAPAPSDNGGSLLGMAQDGDQ